MFSKLECSPELAARFGRKSPEFSAPILFEYEKQLLLTKLELYSYKKNQVEYFYGNRIQKGLMNEIIVTCLGAYDKSHFLEGFELFSEEIGLISNRKKFLFGGDEHFVEAVETVLENKMFRYEGTRDCTYFISEEQEKLVLNAELRPLPEGYVLGSATVEDAQIITKTWKWNSPGEEDHTRQKLSAFPSSCVRFQGAPVAFEMVHPNGMLNHLYVLEEHRGKGLGHIVEQDLCQKLIRKKFAVYKNIEEENGSLIKQTNASPFWTLSTKQDGAPLYRIYMAVWPSSN